MTLAAGNIATGADTSIGLSAGADLASESVPVGRMTVITGEVTTESEYSLLPLDAVFVRSLDDFRSVGPSNAQSFLVTNSGFPLAAELLGRGLLSPDSPITWSLQVPLTETLEQLGQLGLPEDIAVYRVGGTVQRVVVGTAKDGAGRLDLESFQAGVAVIAGLLGNDYPNQASEPDDVRQELNVLRSKHLSLLEVLIPKGQEAVEAPVVKPEDMRKLEDDMFRLERRYEGLDSTYLALQSTYAALDSDYQAMEASYQALETKHVALESSYQAVKASYQALEAKHAALDSSHQALETKYAGLDSRYRALANSRLGKITLRMWERKTSRNKKMQLKEEN